MIFAAAALIALPVFHSGADAGSIAPRVGWAVYDTGQAYGVALAYDGTTIRNCSIINSASDPCCGGSAGLIIVGNSVDHKHVPGRQEASKRKTKIT